MTAYRPIPRGTQILLCPVVTGHRIEILLIIPNGFFFSESMGFVAGCFHDVVCFEPPLDEGNGFYEKRFF